MFNVNNSFNYIATPNVESNKFIHSNNYIGMNQGDLIKSITIDNSDVIDFNEYVNSLDDLSATTSFTLENENDIFSFVTYDWSQVSGDTVTILNEDQLDTSFIAGQNESTILLQLDVNDGVSSGSSTRSIEIIVVNQETCEGISVVERHQIVDAETVVELSAERVHEESTIIWSQVAGDQVEITGFNSETSSFISPSNFSYDSVTVFRVAEVFEGNTTADYTFVTTNRTPIPGKRIKSILDKCKITLGDKEGDRYTDSDLLLLLSEAQEDFSKETNILRSNISMLVNKSSPYVKLPDNVFKLTRITYMDKPLPLVSYEELDYMLSKTSDNEYGFCDGWEGQKGLPKAVVYDKNNLGYVRLYPDPSGLLDDILEDDFGVMTGIDDLVADGSVSSNYGVVADVYDPKLVLNIYYVRSSSEITEITDQLEIPPVYDIALKYYIIGHSFLNDIDTAWQQKGAQQLGFYQKQLDSAKKSTSHNHTNSSTLHTNYRRIL